MIAAKLRDMLRESGIEGTSNKTVYAYKIPESAVSNEKDVQYVFSDISEYPEIEGSNKYRGYEQHVNLKIFFPALSTSDPDVVKNSVIKFLHSKKVRFHDSSGMTTLPDSDRTMISMQFWMNTLLDEAL